VDRSGEGGAAPFVPSLKEFSMTTGPTSQNRSSPAALAGRQRLFQLFRERPMGDEELLVNLGLFMRSGALAKLLFLNELYQKILPIPGLICEFGVWWGQSLVVLENLRAAYEPYNYTRRIVGFDTFTGYRSIGAQDKRSGTITEGVYGVPEGYEDYLSHLLQYHEQENVMGHIHKHELVKGDASVTAKAYFDDHPEALVALAFFDVALYEPTRAALEAIKPRLVRGSIVLFDELNNRDYPGETRAALEVLGAREHTLLRSAFLPDRSYYVIG
jgi:hypothetical protein